MAEFNPSPHDDVVIGGQTYRVMPHPAVPTFAFGQEGRKAFVYQVAQGGNGTRYALKKFKEAYRVPALVDVCDALARFAAWPGLEVCARECLHHPAHNDALDDYPDLEYAVLMPWIVGSTWYDIIIGMRRLSRLQALGIANATAQVLAALEEAGLAHGDIAAANVIVNWNDTSRSGTTHLIFAARSAARWHGWVRPPDRRRGPVGATQRPVRRGGDPGRDGRLARGGDTARGRGGALLRRG
jgi:serine/threonine protein kinase